MVCERQAGIPISGPVLSVQAQKFQPIPSAAEAVTAFQTGLRWLEAQAVVLVKIL